LFSFVLNVVR